MEEFTKETGEHGEILSRHCARLEHHESTVMQNVAKRVAERVGERLSVEPEARDARANCRLERRDTDTRRHTGLSVGSNT
jgi:hypothetical protein